MPSSERDTVYIINFSLKILDFLSISTDVEHQISAASSPLNFVRFPDLGLECKKLG